MPAKPSPLRPHEQRDNYSRRKPLLPPPGNPDIGDSFLIITEGKVTEPMYFEALRMELEVNPVTIKILHPPCTDAEGLVRAAIAERDSLKESGQHCENASNKMGYYDHVWVLFDTDVPTRTHKLGLALELARHEGIQVGLSSPSVEFWLLLHFYQTTAPLLDSKAAEHAVGKAWKRHYDKKAKTFPYLWQSLKPNIPSAVNRAGQVRAHHLAADSEFPPNPSTELDLLVRALNASVRPELRIL